MKRFKFQFITLPRHLSSSKATNSERIDSLLTNFEQTINEMKRFLQDSGYSRRHFFNFNAKISNIFEEKSVKFSESILSNADELTEWNFSKSIINLGSIYRLKEAECLFLVAKLNFPHSSDIYSSMLYSYGKMGEYQEALKLFEEVGLNPSIHLNKKMFEALLDAYSVHVEKQLLNASKVDEKSLESSESIYRQTHSERVLNEISIDPAIKIYQQMLQLKFIPSVSTITRIIRLAGRLKRFGVIEDMIRECERLNLKFDLQAFEVLIFAQMQCGRCEEADETLAKAIPTSDQKEDLGRLFNVILFGYCKLRRPLEVKKILKQFHKYNISISSSALSFIIGTFAKGGFINEAEEYYERLAGREAGNESCTLLTTAANHLLAAYLKEDNFDKFYNLIDKMESNRRDGYTNTLLFEALSRSPKDQNRLSKEIERTKLHISRQSLSPIELSSLFKCLFIHFDGNDQLIKQFVEYVEEDINDRPEDNRKELQIMLLDVFTKFGDWKRSVDTVESIISVESKIRGANPVDPLIFGKLMKAAGPNPDRIEFVLKWMKRVKAWRDPAILTSAMELYWEAGQVEETRELWEEIKGKRNKARSFSIAIAVMAQVFLKEEGPFSALNHLNHYKYLWNNSSVQIYLKSMRLCGTDSCKTIESFFLEKAIKMNPPPNIDVCNEVLISVINNEESLLKVSNWMVDAGVHPNVQTINILISNPDGKIKIAEKMVDEMIKAGGKPSNELLLRLISGYLELSNESGNSAEKYSNLLLTRSCAQINLSLYKLWYNYFIKIGQVERAGSVKEEIIKLNLPIEESFFK